MKTKLILSGLACATLLTFAVPASAQVVIRDGHRGDGVSVRIGERDHHRDRHWRNSRAECKTIKTRTHRPNGTVVVRTKRVCG